MNDSPDHAYAQRGEELLGSAPPPILNLLSTIAGGDYARSVLAARATIAALQHEAPDWVGSAYCCYAHCLKETGEYRESLRALEEANQRGFNLIGAWYYHDANVSSRNFLDDLLGAVKAADEAIVSFHEAGSPSNAADHLSRKANVLKQIASPLSRSEQSRAAAKGFVLEAILASCASIEITQDWEDLDEELSAMARIAARVDLEAADLEFLKARGPHVAAVREKYFTLNNLRVMAASESFNQSIDARKKGDRVEAAKFLKRAFDLAPETTDEDRAFKTFLAYQHGVNLLMLNNLGNYRPGSPLQSSQVGAVKEIRDAWNDCLRLYSTIGEEHLANFNTRFANLTEAVASIRRDGLMRG